MKAIILAGGKGTRLRPLTFEIPKALVPVQGKTLTEHVFDILKRQEVTDILLSVGYKKEMLKEFYGDGKEFGVHLMYIEEEEPLGTAGPLIILSQMGKRLEDTFLVVNGDNLLDVDLRKMVAFHRKHGGLATIALTEVKDPRSYGVAVLEGDRVRKFVEKPARPPSKYINSGWYVLEPEVFDLVEGKRKAMIEKDIFPQLAKQGKLYGFRCSGSWFDTGTHERLRQVEEKWKLE